MLAEVGAQFGLKGIDEAIKKLQVAGREFGKFSSGIDPAVAKAEAQTNRMAKSFEKMGRSIQGSMNMAKAAVAAFVTGKAIKGVADWVAGDEGTDKAKDFLRQYGAGQKEFESYREHLKGLKRRVPGISSADYYTGMYDVQSMFSPQDTEKNKKALESTLYMAKALDPNATIATASNLMRTFGGSFGLGKSEDDQLGLMDKFSAQIRAMLSQTKTRGHDVETSMPHVAALYSQMGRSPADMLADIGIVGGVLHERSGELLRAVMSKEGTGYGKLIASLKKESFLERSGARSEADLPEKLRSQLAKSEKLEETRHARIGSDLLAKDPDAYWRNMNRALGMLEQYRKTRGMDAAKVLSEAFGETAVQGLPLLAKARASGAHGKLKGSLEGADPATAQQEIDASFQSFSAKYEIFKGQVSEMSRSVRAAFQGVVADQFGDYGAFFDRITNLWDRNSKELITNMRTFVAEFKAGFREAFGELPNVAGQVDRLVTLLGSPDPGKWKEIGQEWGKLVGTDAKALSDAISSVLADAKSLSESLKTIADAIKWIKGTPDKADQIKHGMWKDFQADKKPGPQGLMDKAWSYTPWGENFPRAPWMQTAPTASPKAAPENAEFKNWTGGRAPLAPTRQSQAESGSAASGAAPQAGQDITVQAAPVTVNVELDGESIASRISVFVQEAVKREMDRMGYTAGSIAGLVP